MDTVPSPPDQRSAFPPDQVWQTVRTEAEAIVEAEPALASFVYASILSHPTLEDAVVYRLSSRLDHADVPGDLIRRLFEEALSDEPQLGADLRSDISAIYDRDPACKRMLEPILYFKGFAAIGTHRLAHWLWRRGRRDMALYLQSRASAVYGTDIHPAARFGRGLMLDHATGFVVGETAVIEDDCSILHGVTLGGTGKAEGDRHPKIRRGVMIGAGAKILGAIEVGAYSRIAAGSVVLSAVPPCKTVAGVPARIVGDAGCADPSRRMDQMLAEASGDVSEVGTT